MFNIIKFKKYSYLSQEISVSLLSKFYSVVCRNYLIERLMIGITDFDKSEYIQMVVVNPPKYNRMWGADYLLMDSNTFMGGTGGSEYENIIEMFDKIWEKNGYALFTHILA